MRNIVHILKKQKQLLEIEIGELKMNRELGYRGIHSDVYYIKVATAWKLINKSIKALESAEEDIYDNYKYIEN